MGNEYLIPFAKDIWICEGLPVNFYGFDYPTRMTIIKLENDELFIHSPIAPTKEILAEIDKLGEVAFLVSPNKIHHLFLGDWKKIYPKAKMFASPGLKKKRNDLVFDGELQNEPEEKWAKEIDQIIFAGSKAVSEVVFFHKSSKTLILADLIENFEKDWFKGWKRIIMPFVGIIAPNGKAPIDFRLSFLGGKAKAKKSLAQMKAWQPENIIIAHGICFKGTGIKELERAFSWV